MGIFARFKAPSFTAVKCVITSDSTWVDDVRATFGTFEDALIYASATCKQFRDRTDIVHVDVYCNKSGNRVYHAYE